MKIIKYSDKIVITHPYDFDVIQTLNCGQIFRFVIDGNSAKVYSMDKFAYITWDSEKIEIHTDDVEYFYNFFDLDRDYSKIKDELRKDEFLKSAVDYGSGIRIINNDAYEIIISFIISANNNIKRIKNSIEYLCQHFGKHMGSYYAFPTLNELKKVTIQQFKQAGLGYRAEQMYMTVQRLADVDIENLKSEEKDQQFKFLLSLKGVGEKVANCIMLFGLGVKDVFPVDTWINKVYNDLTHTNTTDRKKITQELTARYKDLSGYAQQYFFYYYRDNKINAKIK